MQLFCKNSKLYDLGIPMSHRDRWTDDYHCIIAFCWSSCGKNR